MHKTILMQQKILKTSMLLLFFGLGGLHAQEATVATGGEASGVGGSASYSIGQVAYTNFGTNASVAQGVQQPFEISTTTGIEVTKINLKLSAYPNPTSDFLTLEIGTYEWEKLSYQLLDIQGKLLENTQLLNKNTIINMESLPPSTYFLKIIEGNTQIKTFKIIKN